MTTIGDTPGEHIADAMQLQADAYVDLFHIITTDGAHLFLKKNNTVTWQGNTYEGIGMDLGGEGQTSDTTVYRPQLQVVNPHGIFSAFVVQRRLDSATVIRTRVLKQHLLANRNIYRQKSWKVSRVINLDDSGISIELRNQTDGPNFLTPARMYIPPDFPTVSL